jgi:polyisoprenoid-binding protein YceI
MSKNILFVLMVGVLSALVSCKGDKKTDIATTGDAGTVAAADTNAVSYNLDTTATVVNWTGSKPAGKHTGTIKVSNGNVSVKGGNIVGGAFTLDMNSINVTDLKGGEKMGLEAHLKGLKKGEEDHFFNAPKYPTGKFEVTKVAGVTGDSTATHLVYGNLTLKDVTKEVSFKANVNISEAGVTVKTNPFMINRTDFGIKYASKTFIDNLKDKFVDDNIAVQINLGAKK